MSEALEYLTSRIYTGSRKELDMDALARIARLQEDPATDYLIRLLHNPRTTPSDKVRLLCALAESSREGIRDLIWEQARHLFPLPIEVMVAFGKLKDRRAVPLLSKTLMTNGLYGGERITAAMSLGEIGDERAVPALISVLTADRTYVGFERVWIPRTVSVAEYAVQALTRFKSEPARLGIEAWRLSQQRRAQERIDTLVNLVNRRQYRRWQHNRLLVNLGHFAIDFMNRLSFVEMMDFKLVMIDVFQKLALLPEIIPADARRKILDYVVEQFESQRFSIYSSSYVQLIKFFDEPEIDDLALSWLQTHQSAWRQRDALEILSHRKSEPAIPLIVDMLDKVEDTDDLLYYLLKALARIASTEAQDILENKLQQADIRLKQQLLEEYTALHSGTDGALEFLDELITSGDRQAQMQAIRALVHGADGSFYVLISLLDGTEEQRQTALRALATQGDKRVLPHLIERINYDHLDANIQNTLYAIDTKPAYAILNAWRKGKRQP